MPTTALRDAAFSFRDPNTSAGQCFQIYCASTLSRRFVMSIIDQTISDINFGTLCAQAIQIHDSKKYAFSVMDAYRRELRSIAYRRMLHGIIDLCLANQRFGVEFQGKEFCHELLHEMIKPLDPITLTLDTRAVYENENDLENYDDTPYVMVEASDRTIISFNQQIARRDYMTYVEDVFTRYILDLLLEHDEDDKKCLTYICDLDGKRLFYVQGEQDDTPKPYKPRSRKKTKRRPRPHQKQNKSRAYKK